MVCDEAARIAERDGLSEEARGILVLSALCHDLGKPETTVRNEEGRLVSPDHAEVGAKIAIKFLVSIGCPLKIASDVCILVKEHLAHISISQDPSARTIRRLANRLNPLTIEDLSRLVEADHSGRSPLEKGNPMESLCELAKDMALADSSPIALLMGRHLLEVGIEAGPEMGKILKTAFQAQLDGEFENLEGAVAWFKERRKNEVQSSHAEGSGTGRARQDCSDSTAEVHHDLRR
jgi:tRNA nucleotidyltransferase (CCA-adding enzyme)